MATLNPNLKSFWLNSKGRLRRARNRVLYGGRASSKSWEYAGRAGQIGQQYKTRVLCVRRFQNKIKDSVYTLIKNQIDNFGFTGYNVMASSIEHVNGTEMIFYGIERNIEEIKSTEGVDILWIEEAHNLTKEQWDILEPTIRKAGSEVWISFNPRLASDFIWQYFIVNTPEDSIVRQINYDENPFLSDTMKKVIAQAKKRDYDTYLHIYKGVPLSDDEKVIIKRSWLDAAIDFHKQHAKDNDGEQLMTGPRVAGYDVADSGDDKNCVVGTAGAIAFECFEWQGGENELKKSADRVRKFAIKNDAFIIYDSIGVGAHTGSTLKSSGFNQFSGFNAGGKVHKPNRKYNNEKQREFFSNIKAQAWWLVADRFRNTYDYVVNGNKSYKPDQLISLSSDIKDLEALITELSTPRKDFDNNGKVKVESKKDLAAREIKSPNRADAFIMAYSRALVSGSAITELEVEGV